MYLGWQDYIEVGKTVRSHEQRAITQIVNVFYLAALGKRHSRYETILHLSHLLALNDLLCEPPQ